MKRKPNASKSTATRPVATWLKLTLLLFVPLSFLGCANAPTVLTETKVVEKLVPVRVRLDESLLTDPEPCTLPPTPEFYFFDLDTWAACLEGRDAFRTTQIQKIRDADSAPIPPDGG